MVRLRVLTEWIARLFEFHFNSTMVRLRAGNTATLDLGTTSFQFHYGTIESSKYGYYERIKLISIPLWYDWEPSPLHTAHLFIKFQFHYGTIERGDNITNNRAGRLFQFHYGTIERLLNGNEMTKWKKFQFHYGTIESLAKQPGNLDTRKFQFHYGTIERINIKDDRALAERISIPLWYDWENVYFSSVIMRDEHFNSTMVRLREGVKSG